MSDDAKCPYCGANVEINHDDGYGYGDDLYNQTCGRCDKTFTFTTTTVHYYDTSKADCLNGSPHDFVRTRTIPAEFAQLRCRLCGEERPLPKEDSP